MNTSSLASEFNTDDLITNFANSTDLIYNLKRGNNDQEQATPMPRVERLDIAELACDSLIEITGFDPKNATMSDFFEHLSTDKSQKLLELSTFDDSRERVLNTYIENVFKPDLHDAENTTLSL